MTLLWMDSFDHYTTITQKWTAGGTTSGSAATASITTGGRFGNGVVFSFSNGGAGYMRKDQVAPGNPQTIIVGFAYKAAAIQTGQTIALMQLYDGATVHVDIRHGQTGQLYFTRNGTQIGSASTSSLVANRWYYIEIKVKIDDTTGTAECRVDGVQWLNLTGQDTRNGANAYVNGIYISLSASSGQTFYFDDIYVCDTNGSAPTNDFLGDVRVDTILPNGNGNSSQFVGSDGNSTDNYQLVDETPPSAVDYVESSNVGDKDTYAFSNLTPTSGTVYGVQVIPWAQKTDAGTRSIVSVARLSGTETDSSDKVLSISGAYYPDIRETKPGGGAWSISDVNSAEFGVKVSA